LFPKDFSELQIRTTVVFRRTASVSWTGLAEL